MSNLSDKIELFHVFSKVPVSPGAVFAQAVNRSGHTVSKDDVLVDDIPFFSRNQFKNLEAATAALTAARENDLLQIDNQLYIRQGIVWRPRDPLADGEVLLNYEGTPVLTYHASKALDPVTAANNSNVGSAGESGGDYYYAGRLLKTDGSYVPFFVDVNDKVVNGYPSLGFAPQVKSANLEPVDNGSKFWVNTYSGLVVFEEETLVAQVNISCFEYTGRKLAETVQTVDTVYAWGPRIDSLETTTATIFGWGPSIFGDGPETLEGRISAAEGDIDTLQASAFVWGPRIDTLETNLGTPYVQGPSAFDRLKAIEGAEVKVDSATSQKKSEVENKYLGLFSGQQLYKLYELVSHMTIIPQ